MWSTECAKNSIDSFNKAIENNFGIEMDIRDYRSKIVISHDLPGKNSLALDSFLHNYNLKCHLSGLTKNPPYIAINIKSDGLADKVRVLLIKYNIKNYFIFDMSIPDTIGYLNLGMKVYARISEYEAAPLDVPGVSGFWVDQFKGDWYDMKILEDLFDKFGNLCIVSPELHKREYKNCWNMLKKFKYQNKVSICTDIPELAREFFNEK